MCHLSGLPVTRYCWASIPQLTNDAELRKSIRKFALGEGRLLHSISLAEVQKILQDRASLTLTVTK